MIACQRVSFAFPPPHIHSFLKIRKLRGEGEHIFWSLKHILNLLHLKIFSKSSSADYFFCKKVHYTKSQCNQVTLFTVKLTSGSISNAFWGEIQVLLLFRSCLLSWISVGNKKEQIWMVVSSTHCQIAIYHKYCMSLHNETWSAKISI